MFCTTNVTFLCFFGVHQITRQFTSGNKKSVLLCGGKKAVI